MSSSDSVSNSLGRASGRPLRFFRGLLITRDGVAREGSSVWDIDGEPDGDWDMRVSSSCSSSAAFLFLTDMDDAAACVRKKALAARNSTYLIGTGRSDLGEDEERTAAAWKARCSWLRWRVFLMGLDAACSVLVVAGSGLAKMEEVRSFWTEIEARPQTSGQQDERQDPPKRVRRQ